MSTETRDQEKAEALQEIGKNAYASIVAMVNALECDYDRLAELREERAGLVADARDEGDMDPIVKAGRAAARRLLEEWDSENAVELAELIAEAGEAESREDAEQRIQEDPLSLEVRSGWVTPGEEMTAEDFNILLCTGGPAVRIRGELNQFKAPYRAALEVQDWYTPWTEYFGAEQAVLLTYASQFFFGE